MFRAIIIAAALWAGPAWAQQNSATLPVAGDHTSIATGGVAVVVFAAGAIFHVGDIQNPPSATENLCIDITTTAVCGSGSAFTLQPGGFYRVSGPITTAVSAVAATTGHAFVAVRY